MIEANVAPSSWPDGWLQRTLPAFNTYMNIAVFALFIATLTLSLLMVYVWEWSHWQIKKNEHNFGRQFAIRTETDKRLATIFRSVFYVTNLLMLNVIAIALVDVYIGFTTNRHSIDKPTGRLDPEVLVYGICFGFLLVVVMALAPMLQIMVIAWLSIRSIRKYGVAVSGGNIRGARYFSTCLAYILVFLEFCMVTLWPPADTYSLAQCLVMDAFVGSAMMWLKASSVLNFHMRDIADGGLCIDDDYDDWLIRLFVWSARMIYDRESKNEKFLLGHRRVVWLIAEATMEEK